MLRFTRAIVPTLLTVAIVLGGYFWMREEITSRIYREKLDFLASQYSALAEQYNAAVRQSAITELEVTADAVAVLVRTVDGSIRRVPTPFSPKEELYVDYVVGNGRIWIRRVFDASTPPGRALVIDPIWKTVDWESPELSYGKAIYRTLQPGIWSIQVNGSGALSLERVDSSRVAVLQASPEIRTYEEMQIALDAEVKSIGTEDFWKLFLGLFK
ncbi:hypothetical protein G0Q06_00505 [Puniceicoccales bacterium CK1056]|uniref:Uncharacterized protein n=1 Tax=Oceanipulchritudo coccoides TaxID=2706888 RepID=A0A6B2LY00_9BACT|nr:hypothetical protein [Oceanipulchritudo coccoides]NDV60926.1 hypothetical protein [Oceanipulchritudo coccoides]